MSEKYKNGYYYPKNINKFDGLTRCQYRSSWELMFLKWCENNPNVIKIYYEKTIIPYICKTDNKLHKYYIDIKLIIKENDQLKTYLIEIKPYNKTLQPKISKRKSSNTLLYERIEYIKNMCKWDAAKQYCKTNNFRWCILTEKGIYIDGKFHNITIFT